MPFARIALLATITAAFAACGGGSRNQGADSAAVDTAARAADSAAKAARTGPQRVANVMIGKRLGSGNRIAEPTFQFAPPDTVHLSVTTAGRGEATALTAAWRYQSGEILQKSSEPVPAGGGTAGFSLSQPKGLSRAPTRWWCCWVRIRWIPRYLW